MGQITDIKAEEILDSRGKPTVKATVRVGEHEGMFSVPSGASTGSKEAVELRDADGHVSQALKNIHDIIAPKLVGMDAREQEALDTAMRELDGTKEKSKLGGNAMLAVSIAVAKAAVHAEGVELWQYLRDIARVPPSRSVPYLYMNYINGGKHTGANAQASLSASLRGPNVSVTVPDSTASSPFSPRLAAKAPARSHFGMLSFQEHMIVPESESIAEALDIAEAVSARLEELIRARYGDEAAASMGDEGGYVIPERDPIVPFELLAEATAAAGQKGRVRLATDVAASSFFDAGAYAVGGEVWSAEQLRAFYHKLADLFPLLSIEDPFEEHAMQDFVALQRGFAPRIVGDDLTVTDAARIKEAAHKGAIRAVIIKPNQIGTLTETFEAMRAARRDDVDCIVSHRSGETDDTFIADLAFATGAFGLKAGSLRKSERRAKYERLKVIAA
ncbi:phosphopyruvate hydratase [Candidatus Kaiserbacteria bacterium]|nr:phosphopyruvate hydratase [Candidatus Kaiserbacteria bacterium]